MQEDQPIDALIIILRTPTGLKVKKDAHSVAESGVMNSGTTKVIDSLPVSASSDQFVYYSDVTVPTRNMQRCLTVVIMNIQLSTVTHQQPQHLHSARLVYRVSAAVTCLHTQHDTDRCWIHWRAMLMGRSYKHATAEGGSITMSPGACSAGMHSPSVVQSLQYSALLHSVNSTS